MTAARFVNQGAEREGDWTFVLVDSFNDVSAIENAEETIRFRSAPHLKRGAMDNSDPCSQNAKLSATFTHKPSKQQTEQECGPRMLLHIALAGSCNTSTQFTQTIAVLEKIPDLTRKCRRWAYNILNDPQNTPALSAWITTMVNKHGV